MHPPPVVTGPSGTARSSPPSPGPGPGPRQWPPTLGRQHRLPFGKYAEAPPTRPARLPAPLAPPRPRPPRPGGFQRERAPNRRSPGPAAPAPPRPARPASPATSRPGPLRAAALTSGLRGASRALGSGGPRDGSAAPSARAPAA